VWPSWSSSGAIAATSNLLDEDNFNPVSCSIDVQLLTVITQGYITALLVFKMVVPSLNCWLCRPTEASEQNVELNELGFVYYDVGR
jgi:hypothetical protein